MFFDGSSGLWAELAQEQKDVTIEYMRDVHSLKQDGQLTTNQNGIDTGKHFSWKNSAQELINGL